MPEPRRWRRRWPGALLALAALAGLGYALWRAQGPPEGPWPVAYDRTACSRCRMLVSAPRFAGQLHGEDGRVLFFDDPGCLLLWESEHDAPVRAVWLHHLHQEAWIARADAVFVPADEPTPMGYGLGAARRAEAPDGLGPDAALARVQARERERTGGGG